MLDKRKARVGGATPAAGYQQNSHSQCATGWTPQQGKTFVESARLRYLARRPVDGYLRETVARADVVVERLEDFARLDPAILSVLGGVALPHVLAASDVGRTS